MSNITSQIVWNCNEKEFISLLNSDKLKPLDKTIRFYVPSFIHYSNEFFKSTKKEFPTISITGNDCALNCKHCGGKLLETMHSALSPIELFNIGSKLKQDGAKGVLITGGCRYDGSVPLENFVSVLHQLKYELDLTVFVHTGIIKAKTATALKNAGVDAALMDVVCSKETLKEIFNSSLSVKDYVDSLKALYEAKLKIVPHVIVGLNRGKLDGEYEALKIIAQTIKPSALVIIAFMPIHGTEMEKSVPPTSLEVARVIATARVMFPDTPISLGCMRPKGEKRKSIDVLALKAGVDAIAFPDEEAIKYAKNKRYNTVFLSYCCAQIGIN